MPNIDVFVKNKIATGIPGQYVVCGNGDFTVKFNFDSEWDEYEEKTARFVWAEGFEDVNFSGSDCQMPVIANTNNVAIGVYAGEQLHTTTPVVVIAKKSILDGNIPEGGTIITKGAKGDPGVSPVVSVTEITGGHRINIVDKEHTSTDPITFDVMDGDNKTLMITLEEESFSPAFENISTETKLLLISMNDKVYPGIKYSGDNQNMIVDVIALDGIIRLKLKSNNTYEFVGEKISFESVANKTNHLSGSPDDVHYPTEKAVVEALQLLAESLSGSIALKQDILTAGQNITIENNVISASGTVEDWDVEYRITFEIGDTLGYAKYNKEKWLNFGEFLDAVSLYYPGTEGHHDPIVKGNFYLFGYVNGLQLIPESITTFDYMGIMTIYFNAVNDELGLENKFKCELMEDYEKLDGTLTFNVEEIA